MFSGYISIIWYRFKLVIVTQLYPVQLLTISTHSL